MGAKVHDVVSGEELAKLGHPVANIDRSTLWVALLDTECSAEGSWNSVVIDRNSGKVLHRGWIRIDHP